MHDFLLSKATEHSILISHLKHELVEHRSSDIHSELISDLISRLEAANFENALVLKLLKSREATFVRRAAVKIHNTELDILAISSYYLPGIKKECSEEISFRKIALAAARDCGLTHVADILVRLDSPFSIWTYGRFPILFAPPQQIATLTNMSYLYHELGHAFVAGHYVELINALRSQATQFLEEFGAESGPMSPDKSGMRLRRIDKVTEYWLDDARLNELFSDVFAAYSCGPAYLYGCVNLAITHCSDPYEVMECDEHPPAGFRVQVCKDTLETMALNNSLSEDISRIWQGHCRSLVIPSEYWLYCQPSLSKLLVSECLKFIERAKPTVRRCSGAQVNHTNLNTESYSLDELLNASTKRILTNPDQYREWESEALRAFLDRMQ